MESVAIPHAIFESHIFASVDATREHLTYIQISMRGDHVIGRATDGHRAFELKLNGVFPKEGELYISKANAQKLCKAATTKKARQGVWVIEVLEDGAHFSHADLGITIAIPVLLKLDKDYPDLTQIFPMVASQGLSAVNLWGINLAYLLDVERWRKRVGLEEPDWVKVQTPVDPLSPLMISEWNASAEIQWKTIVMPARLP